MVSPNPAPAGASKPPLWPLPRPTTRLPLWPMVTSLRRPAGGVPLSPASSESPVFFFGLCGVQGDIVCMYARMVITYSKSMDQPGKVTNPARGQLNRENEYFPVPVRA